MILCPLNHAGKLDDGSLVEISLEVTAVDADDRAAAWGLPLLRLPPDIPQQQMTTELPSAAAAADGPPLISTAASSAPLTSIAAAPPAPGKVAAGGVPLKKGKWILKSELGTKQDPAAGRSAPPSPPADDNLSAQRRSMEEGGSPPVAQPLPLSQTPSPLHVDNRGSSLAAAANPQDAADPPPATASASCPATQTIPSPAAPSKHVGLLHLIMHSVQFDATEYPKPIDSFFLLRREQFFSQD